MTLFDLASAHPQSRGLAVPSWTLGCFRRRSITYANGAEDARTHVIWIQSHGLTGDLRIPAGRPTMTHRASPAECSREELMALCLAEGGVAEAAFTDGRMRWSAWCAFQPYDKWPEPGVVRRVGTCLIEFAPSGIYVEDWRLQPSRTAPLVGLRLVKESLDDRPASPRDGGLVIAGDHAILSLGRWEPLASDEPLSEQLRTAPDPADLAQRIFSAEASYARRQASGRYVIELSTNPWATGMTLDLHGFEPSPRPGLLIQECEAGLRRTWRVDTLLPDAPCALDTPALASGAEWLRREVSRLPGAERTRSAFTPGDNVPLD